MSDNIMFDYSDWYDKMAELLPAGAKVCEVGCADGLSALYLVKKMVEKEKGITMYMVDNMDYGGFIQMKHIYQNIIKSGLGQYVEVIPKPSLEAVNDFNDGYLSLVFIDSSHTYPETANEIRAWFPKVKDGYWLSGHDANSPEVRRSINEVVPEFITREPLPDGQRFKPEKILNFYDTTNGYGVFEVKKDWYIKLK